MGYTSMKHDLTMWGLNIYKGGESIKLNTFLKINFITNSKKEAQPSFF